MIDSGVAPFPSDQHLKQYLFPEFEFRRLAASLDTAVAVRQLNAVVVILPFLIGSEVMSECAAMDGASKSVASGLRPGALVSHETALPVGATRNQLVPVLEEHSGLVLHKDFFVL